MYIIDECMNTKIRFLNLTNLTPSLRRRYGKTIELWELTNSEEAYATILYYYIIL